LFVFQPRDAEDLRRRTQRARARGASEWHVHLLAETPEARASLVSELSPADGLSPDFFADTSSLRLDPARIAGKPREASQTA
ncbi:MAG TPA: hypothetical protein VMU18_08370, partial [Rhodoblastus sp.]|nr:hypothetical protein [Rhodoblastus sp.]